MSEKILVALDHSPTSDEVFQAGLKLAKALNADMVLLHVLSRGAADSPTLPAMPVTDYYPSYNAAAMELFEEAWKAYEAKGKEMLHGYVSQAEEAGVEAEPKQVDGAPGLVVCDTASELGVEMIVMGRRGHSGLSELFLGSVSNYVLHHAPCSVHILQNRPQKS